MKIDFHTHVKLAKYLPFSPVYTDWLFKEAQKAGLDAICITEHFNTLGFDEVYNYIKENYPREGDTFLIDGLRIFTGMEIDIAEGGHILGLGKIEDILTLNYELTPYKNKGEFLPFSKLLEKAKINNIYLGAAHPFREGSNIPFLSTSELRKLDFVDLNGKDYAIKGKFAEEEIIEFAQKIEVPIVAGSDTHQSLQYGCIYNILDKECTTVTELMAYIKKSTHKIKVHECVDLKVNSATLLKKALKEIHTCGGDYISVVAEENQRNSS